MTVALLHWLQTCLLDSIASKCTPQWCGITHPVCEDQSTERTCSILCISNVLKQIYKAKTLHRIAEPAVGTQGEQQIRKQCSFFQQREGKAWYGQAETLKICSTLNWVLMQEHFSLLFFSHAWRGCNCFSYLIPLSVFPPQNTVFYIFLVFFVVP